MDEIRRAWDDGKARRLQSVLEKLLLAILNWIDG
jgi:hypothetical protein